MRGSVEAYSWPSLDITLLSSISVRAANGTLREVRREPYVCDRAKVSALRNTNFRQTLTQSDCTETYRAVRGGTRDSKTALKAETKQIGTCDVFCGRREKWKADVTALTNEQQPGDHQSDDDMR